MRLFTSLVYIFFIIRELSSLKLCIEDLLPACDELSRQDLKGQEIANDWLCNHTLDGMYINSLSINIYLFKINISVDFIATKGWNITKFQPV